jgi:hypothetical protein
MQLSNLTPFDVLGYAALDPGNREHRVLVMKVGYQLHQNPSGRWSARVMDENPTSLCMADEYEGEPGESSIIQESDLAPCKPRCDVLVRANAYAPKGIPSRQWEVAIQITAAPIPVAKPKPPHPLNPTMGLTPNQARQWQQAQQAYRKAVQSCQQRVLLDKRLTISGPAQFRKHVLTGWQRSRPELVSSVPIRWEKSFGGRCFVPAKTDAADAKPLLNEVCFQNPLGQGWIEKRWHKLAKQRSEQDADVLPAPQVEYPDDLVSQPCITSQEDTDLSAKQMAKIAEEYGHRSAGLGATGRAWAPRLALAGTYDQNWLEKHHPGLPSDFDFGYWNAAPLDQQTEYLPPDARIQTWNLTPAQITPDGHLDVSLPGHRPFVLLHLENDFLLALPMLTDTVILDMQSMTISLTHRSWIPEGMPVSMIEARFEADPDAPLVKRFESQLEQH